SLRAAMNYFSHPPPSPSDPPLLDTDRFQKLLRRSSLALTLSLAIPVCVLLGLVLYLLRASALVEHTDNVINHAKLVDQSLLQMQTGFRGYRLSGDESHLESYRRGSGPDGVLSELRILSELVTDNPGQGQAIERIRTHVKNWFAFVDGELAAVSRDPAMMQNPGFLKVGVPLFDVTTSSVDAFIKEERRLRRERAKLLNRVVAGVLLTFGVIALAGIPALSFWLNRLLRSVNFSFSASLRAAAQRAEELQVTLHSIGDAVVVTDAEGRVDFLNPVAENLMGWPLAEARGKALTEVFPIFNERTGAIAENPVDRVLRENVVVGLANHTVLHSRGGSRIPIEDSAAPIRTTDGKVRGVILVFHDVTEKYEAAGQLRESESRLSFLNRMGEMTGALTDSAAMRQGCVDLLGKFLHTSRCAYATVEAGTGRFAILNDYTDGCGSVRGEYELKLFGPRAVEKMLSGRTLVIRDMDSELSDAEGGDVFRSIGVRAIICCPLLKNGELRAMMAVHQTTPRAWTTADVSLVETVVERCWSLFERKRAESELVAATQIAENAALAAADAADRFRMLGEVISLQVWTATPDGKLDYVNDQVHAYFGTYDDTQVLGTAWTDFVHPDDLSVATERWQKALATGERYVVEFRLRRGESGDYSWFLVRAEAMRAKDGTTIKWFGTNTAIHDLKTAQQNAERANRAKDEFLAALSHELRTPLTPVLMTAAALRDDTRLPADVLEQLAMMERNISLEARLIDDLLDLTSIARGKLTLRAEPCDAHSLISLAVDIVRSDAQSKGLKLDRDFLAAHSGLIADPARFQQVIWNLLRNAVKFTPPDGRISIRTRDETDEQGKQWLRIEVSDTGIGIDPESLEQIFLPFEQATATGDHRFGGVGLGLSIAKAIVGLHGGSILAKSEGAQRGSTFVVEFPEAVPPPSGFAASPTDGIPQPASTPGDGRKPIRPLRLLMVEDHAATLEALSNLLVRDGHTVTAASTVADALTAAENNTFDLVISDLGLPDGTGIQLMEQLRDRYQLKGIALSGYGMEEDLIRCREAGFVTHLVKPVRFADLRRVMGNAV
ncbi:MAG: domain S-box, partial [Verrucomicrobiales bacterium]|nr:domain S-box [Verrucomicrobiales bacterium]